MTEFLKTLDRTNKQVVINFFKKSEDLTMKVASEKGAPSKKILFLPQTFAWYVDRNNKQVMGKDYTVFVVDSIEPTDKPETFCVTGYTPGTIYNDVDRNSEVYIPNLKLVEVESPAHFKTEKRYVPDDAVVKFFPM